MNNEYEYIKPWDGEHDTGYDVRKKLENNFKKIAGNFNEIANELQSYLKKNEDGNIEELIAFLNGIKIGDKQLLDIIRSVDEAIESDTNVYSAAKTHSKFLKKDEADTAAELLTFLKGIIVKSGATADYIHVIETLSAKLVDAAKGAFTDVEVTNQVTTLNLIVKQLAKTYDFSVDHVATLFQAVVKDYVSSEDFVSGLTGSGMKIYKALDGDWNMEIDNLTVRKIFSVFELVVQKIVHQGGMVIRSAGGAKLTKVVDGGSYWRCEHDSTDDFVTGDQILCQTFTGSTIKRYWRLVTSAGAGYFNLSKADCETNSAAPETSDEVVVLGNRTVTARQSAQIDCAVGDTAPYRDDYEGINSYSLDGKLITRVGNLSGIVDAVFGALTGSGMYGKNVRLKGDFILESTGKSVSTELSDVKTSITTVQTTLSVLDGRITASVTETKSYADSVSAIAKKAAIDDAATKYTTKSDFSAQVNILSTQITTKVSQSDFNALGQRVTNTETTITQQAGLIALKADSSTVDSLATRVASAELKITSTAIISTVQSTINSAKDSAISSATATAATDATNKVNAIKIGGRNLLYKSLKATWGIATTSDFLTFSCNAPQGSSTGVRMDIKNSMELNTRYTLSYKIKILSGGLYHIGGHDGGFGNCYNLRVNDTLLTENFNSGNAYTPSVPYTAVNSILKISYELQISATPTDYFYIQPNRGATFEAISYILYDIKFEKGNKATDWTPAPEDVTADAQAKANTAESNAKGYADSTFTTKSDFAAQVTILSNQINLKVAQTDFNALGQRVSSSETNITSLSGAISLKASQSDLTALTNRVSTAELSITPSAIISTVQSSINSAKDSAISTAAADATSKANTAQANAINTASTDATTKVNAVQVGGRNFIRNSANWVNLNSWTSNGSTMSIVTIDGASCMRLVGANGATQLIGKQLKPNTEYTFSAYMRSTVALSGGGDNQLHVQVWRDEDTGNVHQDIDVSADTSLTANVWKLATHTFKTPNSAGLCYCRLYFYPLSSGTVDIRYCKLEAGNKATDWTPAPEDVDASIAAAQTAAIADAANKYTTITTYNTQIAQLNNAISAKAETSTVNTLTGRVATAEGNITVMSGQISSKVSTTDYNGSKIASLVTQTPAAVSVLAQNILVAGAVTFSMFSSDAQGKVNTAQTTADKAVSNITTLQNSLGVMAYQSLVSLAKLDTTIVEGGYIKTSLINADAIITNQLLANKIAATDITTNRLAVTSGAKIGAFAVTDGLSYDNGSDSLIIGPMNARIVTYDPYVDQTNTAVNTMQFSKSDMTNSLNRSNFTIGKTTHLGRAAFTKRGTTMNAADAQAPTVIINGGLFLDKMAIDIDYGYQEITNINQLNSITYNSPRRFIIGLKLTSNQSLTWSFLNSLSGDNGFGIMYTFIHLSGAQLTVQGIGGYATLNKPDKSITILSLKSYNNQSETRWIPITQATWW